LRNTPKGKIALLFNAIFAKQNGTRKEQLKMRFLFERAQFRFLQYSFYNKDKKQMYYFFNIIFLGMIGFFVIKCIA